MKHVDGLVLAGGKSTRMGENKALLEYKGKSWLQTTAELLARAGVSDIFINGFTLQGYQTVDEVYPDLGPLSGIYAGLCATMRPLLIVPVDMPTLPVSQLQEILSLAHRFECVYFSDSPLPCFLSNNERIRERVRDVLTDDKLSKSLFSTWKTLSSKHIATDHPLQNFNTPEDLTLL